MTTKDPSTPCGESRIRTVFLDAAGTLFGLRRSVGEDYGIVAREFGFTLPAEAADRAFAEVWAAGTYPEYPPGSDAEACERIDHAWWKAMVTRVFTACGEETRENGAFDRCFEALYRHYGTAAAWQLYPDVDPVLDTLRNCGMRLFVFSNFDRRLHTLADELGIAEHFEKILVSSELGACKPSPTAFERALQEAGCEADETLHAGDEPAADWHGAENAGLHVFRLNRTENDLGGLLEKLRCP